jgi:hypothetical protein
MIRELAGRGLVPPEKHFHWRGGEITRLEAFTDAVFAFAVTLLVVSLEVPKTYAELISAMKGFVAFAICFAVLAQIWHRHYLFSRRYGLQTQGQSVGSLFRSLTQIGPKKPLIFVAHCSIITWLLSPGTR